MNKGKMVAFRVLPITLLLVLSSSAVLKAVAASAQPVTSNEPPNKLVPILTGDYTLKYRVDRRVLPAASDRKSYCDAEEASIREAIMVGRTTAAGAESSLRQLAGIRVRGDRLQRFEVTLSVHRNKMRMESTFPDNTTVIYDGANTYSTAIGFNMLDVTPGLDLNQFHFILNPGAGILGIPLIKLAVGEQHGSVLRGDVYTGRCQHEGDVPIYMPGTVTLEQKPNRLARVASVEFSTADNGYTYRWDFEGAVTVAKTLIARSAHWLHTVDRRDKDNASYKYTSEKSDYTLVKYNDEPVQEQLFSPDDLLHAGTEKDPAKPGTDVRWHGFAAPVEFQFMAGDSLEHQRDNAVAIAVASSSRARIRVERRPGIAGPILLCALVGLGLFWLARRKRIVV